LTAHNDCTPANRCSNQRIFQDSIYTLIQALRGWLFPIRLFGTGQPLGVYVEIGVYSPSDGQHVFRSSHLADGYPYQSIADVDGRLPDDYGTERAAVASSSAGTDKVHGWDQGRRLPVPLSAHMRVEGSGLTLTYIPDRAYIVTGLTIRQLSRRHIDALVVDCLFASFPNLREFVDETGHTLYTKQSTMLQEPDVCFPGCFCMTDLRRVILFRTPFGELGTDANDRLLDMEAPNRAAFSQALTRTALAARVTTFSASFVVEADALLSCALAAYSVIRGAIETDMAKLSPWSRLVELNLTSSTLCPCKPLGARQQLLVMAGESAYFMPALKRVSLWNGRRGNYYVFQYLNDGARATVKLRSSFAGRRDLSRRVISSWANIALVPLSVEVEAPCNETPVRTCAPAVELLMRDGHSIMHPITARRIIAEEKCFPPTVQP